MNPSVFIPIVTIWIVIFLVLRENQRAVTLKRIIERRKNGRNDEMKELAERFIGKECIINSFDRNYQFNGVIREVSDSAILLEKNGTVEAINLDFVIRIREYPKNKKGKKKSIVTG